MSNKACFRSHTGLFMVEPRFGQAMVRSVLSGALVPFTPEQAAAAREAAMYVVEDGVAVVNVDGPLLKHHSKYGGTSSNRLREMLREMQDDPAVTAALFVVDSPGGSVAGTDPLALELRELSRYLPTHVHVENLCASAALYMAAQVNTISAAEDAEVGSIGTVMVVEDHSKRYEKEGVKAHVISSGALKGAGAEGAEITDEMLAQWQQRVDAVTERFIARVAEGRGMDPDEVRKLATGEVFSAEQALDLGLIDGTSTFDKALAAMQAMHGNGVSRRPDSSLINDIRYYRWGVEPPVSPPTAKTSEKTLAKGVDNPTGGVSNDSTTQAVGHKMLGIRMNASKVRKWLTNTDEGKQLLSDLRSDDVALLDQGDDMAANIAAIVSIADEDEAETLVRATDAAAAIEFVEAASAQKLADMQKQITELEAARTQAENRAFAIEAAAKSGGALTPAAVMAQLEGASGDLLEERKKRMQSEAEKLSVKNEKAAADVKLAETPREAFDALWEAGRFGTTDESRKPAFWAAWIAEDERQ